MKNSQKLNILAFMLVASLPGCSSYSTLPSNSSNLTTYDPLETATRVVECEWKAADRYDDGHRSIADVAQQIVGICGPELIKARVAVGISPSDPRLDADELNQAVKNIELVRKKRKNSK